MNQMLKLFHNLWFYLNEISHKACTANNENRTRPTCDPANFSLDTLYVKTDQRKVCSWNPPFVLPYSVKIRFAFLYYAAPRSKTAIAMQTIFYKRKASPRRSEHKRSTCLDNVSNKLFPRESISIQEIDGPWKNLRGAIVDQCTLQTLANNLKPGMQFRHWAPTCVNMVADDQAMLRSTSARCRLERTISSPECIPSLGADMCQHGCWRSTNAQVNWRNGIWQPPTVRA